MVAVKEVEGTTIHKNVIVESPQSMQQQQPQQQGIDNEIIKASCSPNYCGMSQSDFNSENNTEDKCGGRQLIKDQLIDIKDQFTTMKKRRNVELTDSASLFKCFLGSSLESAELDNNNLKSTKDGELLIGLRPIPASDISNPDRTICIVTTAALPWRTGTAVNPLLRALYLIRYQNEKRKELLTISSSTDEERKGSVTLVIPWLESEEDRIKLYGQQNSFSNTNQKTGIQQQEEYIRQYCSTSNNMKKEAEQLQLLFYPAFYLSGFGSIFPKVDLCNFIPEEFGIDVAILEEPEHLNWFRMPYVNNNKNGGSDEGEHDDIKAKEELLAALHGAGDGDKTNDKVGYDDADDGEGVEMEQLTIHASSSSNDIFVHAQKKNDTDSTPPADSTQHSYLSSSSNNNSRQKKKLGWAHRFNFVVGIVHTNYEAYARQYGIGASLIAAPAIGALSALCMRAYCHQIIKLSDTLPCLAPGKEVTCNTHGVRSEFLEGIDMNMLAGGGGVRDGGSGDKSNEEEEEVAPVYFIGKLVWAKGFDLMLELQNIFRKKNGHYFKVDIYGGGPDEKAIARAFHGRHHTSPATRPPPTTKSSSNLSPTSSHPSMTDLNAQAVFDSSQSIKDQSEQIRRQSFKEFSDCSGDDVISQYLSLGFEVSQMNGSATYVNESRNRLPPSAAAVDNNIEVSPSPSAHPLDILGDLSGKTFDTGGKTSQAVYNIADSSIKNILIMSFSQLKHPLKAIQKKTQAETGAEKEDVVVEEEKAKFVFDPPATRYEFRRHPIPAKFPGVIDHCELKNMSHKIFLNPSTSEVLCTTTAEALAMNKFVIIPKHPSNDFFMQFSNCLSYDTLDECADKMLWALENTPKVMSDEERHKFTWQAATGRLIESSIVSVKQARERAENGMDKTDARIAYWLSESGEKSNMIRNLFNKNNAGDSPVTL